MGEAVKKIKVKNGISITNNYKKLSILIFNYEYPPIGGGGGVICKDIADEIASGGNNVTVITSHYEGLKKNENLNGVRIIRVPVLFRGKQNTASLPSMLSYVPSAVSAAKKLLKTEKFDVINTHFAIPTGPAGNSISRKFNIPNILSIHGGDIFDPSKSLSPHKTFGLKQTVRKMLLNADRVVAQSSDTRKNASYYYGVKRNIDIIPLAIKPNSFSKKSKEELGLSKDKNTFITIGRLVRRKNLEELIDIFSKVSEQLNCELIIVGNGPEYDNLYRKINNGNLQEKVKLAGRVSEELKFQYLSASDVYLSTAMHEGFGIVFLEAMECGLPVICYDRGGQVDFLKSGETGYLIKLGDTKSFYENLLALLKDKELREKISIFNKQLVKKFYINNIARQYLSIFEEVISKA